MSADYVGPCRTQDDLSGALGLVRALQRHEEACTGHSYDDAGDRLLEDMVDQEVIALVAWRGGVPVGVMVARPDLPCRTILLEKAYIVPTDRGTTVLLRLWRQVLELSERLRCPRILASVLEENTVTRGMLQRSGCAVVARAYALKGWSHGPKQSDEVGKSGNEGSRGVGSECGDEPRDRPVVPAHAGTGDDGA